MLHIHRSVSTMQFEYHCIFHCVKNAIGSNKPNRCNSCMISSAYVYMRKAEPREWEEEHLHFNSGEIESFDRNNLLH